MSESTAAATAQAELPHPETGIMRGSAVMDSCPTSNHHHIISTESSVVSSSNTETGLKKPSSGASTATTSSGMGTSSSTDKLPVPQDNSKTRTPIVLQMNAPHHPVAEFLFQLTKMLTDDNKEYIEWRRASIFVTDPPVSFCRRTSHFLSISLSNIFISLYFHLAGARELHPTEILSPLQLFKLCKCTKSHHELLSYLTTCNTDMRFLLSVSNRHSNAK